MSKGLMTFFLVFICLDVLADEGAFIDAKNRFQEIVTNENAFTSEWSSSYYLMHKRVHGENAYLKDFTFLDGVASESKAAFMYKVFDMRDQTWGEHLIRMALEGDTWQVISISTYSLKSFKANANELVR